MGTTVNIANIFQTMLQKKYDWETLKAGVLIGYRTVTVQMKKKKKDNTDNDNMQEENI
jgi:hypothetical protein